MNSVVVYILCSYVLILVLAGFCIRRGINYFRKNEENLAKQEEFVRVLTRWIKLKQRGIDLKRYFERNGYNSIAVYGAGELGKLLYEELKNSGTKILYVIDMDPNKYYYGLNVVNPCDELKTVDAVIVTAIHGFIEIKKMLIKKMRCPIISLEDVVHDAKDFLYVNNDLHF